MNIEKKDKRVVMTLDAGGTNFVFSAIKGMKEIVEPVRLPSNAHDLQKCLETIIDGFSRVKAMLKEKPVAISFAFPGPADYPRGIIGDLGNMPSFRGGVALGPMLEEKFGMPVYINNDGDLFVYGEVIGGFLPYVNRKLELSGSHKRYKNLFGVTLGTGFGAGITINGEMFVGDNSCGAEIWIMRNSKYPACFIEESASIRAVQRVYMREAHLQGELSLSPKDIFDIATGTKEGNKQAAIAAFTELGETVGDALANAITLIDGLIVIGGGLSAAAQFFMPALIHQMNGHIHTMQGEKIPRLPLSVYNLEEESQFAEFVKGEEKEISVPFSNRKIIYDAKKRIGVGLARMDTSKAVSIGAYAFALTKLA